ncbi:sulfate transporter-like isoform X2 [Uloborus diversus]|uniref:sulfate transporter-like isoform X2 n=1 Tax=Uloborus diversus TaxID=327109 RepID=UPI00240A1DC3|nr:sulfate transporter-like isoform X2 [Uloborus diversus]
MTPPENGGDPVSDSERIRILPTSAARSSSFTSAVNDSLSRRPHEDQSSFGRAGSSSQTEGARRKRFLSQTENDDHRSEDRAFYNMGFSLSPSDLERSWKQWRSGMNGSNNNKLRRSKSDCRISIHRYPIDNSYIDKKYGIMPTESSSHKAITYLKSHCACNLAWVVSFFTSLFPVLSWLPKYRLEYLLPDIIAGFTIAILHIPQGMAYGVLASLKAENGLYVSFFPVLIYFLLGTSRHISIGTFAVMSLMMSSAVHNANFIADNMNATHLNATTTPEFNNLRPPTPLEIGTALAMGVGFWQLFMGVFRLGSLTVVLSDLLVSGFTTGAAFHVATTQLKDLLGVHIGSYTGALKLVYMLRDIFKQLPHSNAASLIISFIALFVLILFKEQIDGRLKGRLKMPIPIDLIVVVLATTASYFGNFYEKYDVSVIKDIPIGIPPPTTPRVQILPSFIMDSFAIAIVAFVISLSMAKLLAKKHKYFIRPNQELIALGCANVFSSFFACYPCSASLSRSLVQERAGGKTQVAGVVSCGLLLVVLLALAPMFYSLPKCILSCIILVALKGMFLQVKDFFNAWGISKVDALIWLVTFLSTVLLDITYGLLVGVIFAILSVILRTVIPSRTILGQIPDTDIYVDIKRYDLAQEVTGIKIIHFESALYFINKELFKNYIEKHVPLKIATAEDSETKNPSSQIHRIIIDCSTFTFVDIAGLEALLEVMKEYKDIGIVVFLSGCSIAMQGVMEKANFQEKVPHHPAIFPTIHDAVVYNFQSQMHTSKS